MEGGIEGRGGEGDREGRGGDREGRGRGERGVGKRGERKYRSYIAHSIVARLNQIVPRVVCTIPEEVRQHHVRRSFLLNQRTNPVDNVWQSKA